MYLQTISSLFSVWILNFFKKVTISTNKSTLSRASIALRNPTIFRFFILRSTAGSSARFSNTWKHKYSNLSYNTSDVVTGICMYLLHNKSSEFLTCGFYFSSITFLLYHTVSTSNKYRYKIVLFIVAIPFFVSSCCNTEYLLISKSALLIVKSPTWYCTHAQYARKQLQSFIPLKEQSGIVRNYSYRKRYKWYLL